MRFCFICNEYPPCLHGGIGVFYRELAEGLTKLGHSVTVVGIYYPWILELEDSVHEIINGVNVYRLSSTRKVPGRVAAIIDRIRLKRWLKNYYSQKPFDIIESPEGSGWVCFGGISNVPLIIRLHGSQIYLDAELQRRGSRLLRLFERITISKADFILSVSNYVGKRTLELCKSNKSYTVIYNAVNTTKFTIKREIPTIPNLIVFVGSISPKKGVVELMQAMSLVWLRVPLARLMMVGKEGIDSVTGEKLSNVLYKLIEPSKREQITFTGSIPHEETIDILNKATVCCYPSHVESFSLAPLEAMAVGKPVIFMKYGSGPEAIEDGVSGLLCNTRSYTDVAEKIIMVLENQLLAKKLSDNARKRILENFELQSWLQTNIDWYQAYLKNHHRSDMKTL